MQLRRLSRQRNQPVVIQERFTLLLYFWFIGLLQVEQLAAVGVSCVFEILRQLSKRDPDLCVQALASLLVMLQNMPADSLRNEPRSSLDSMMSVLRGLREEGGFLFLQSSF